jgi:hypothetical protein
MMDPVVYGKSFFSSHKPVRNYKENFEETTEREAGTATSLFPGPAIFPPAPRHMDGARKS